MSELTKSDYQTLFFVNKLTKNTLNLSEGGVTREPIGLLVEFLHKNPIYHLDLSFNNISNSDIEAILMDGVECSKTILSLDLSKSHLNHMQCQALSRCISTCNTLRMLNLSYNALNNQSYFLSASKI